MERTCLFQGNLMVVFLKPSMQCLLVAQHVNWPQPGILNFYRAVDEPHEHHAAMPLSVVLALTALSLFYGWSREAELILLGWTGALRAGELFGAARDGLVLPCKMLSQGFCTHF